MEEKTKGGVDFSSWTCERTRVSERYERQSELVFRLLQQRHGDTAAEPRQLARTVTTTKHGAKHTCQSGPVLLLLTELHNAITRKC